MATRNDFISACHFFIAMYEDGEDDVTVNTFKQLYYDLTTNRHIDWGKYSNYLPMMLDFIQGNWEE